MTGGDVIFGDAHDDVIVGGWGHDWISGGTGRDAILGDDGHIFTSRNGLAEPLFGIAAIPASELDKRISTPGNMQVAVINRAGALARTALHTVYDADPSGALDPLYRASFADDIIYGGWDDDWVHGGFGDDAISGAEAPVLGYILTLEDGLVARSDWYRPYNPGNALFYGVARPGEFGAYDENDPWRRVAGPEGEPFFLDFEASDGRPIAGSPGFNTDGNDVLFGGFGNDWLVGGTGRDIVFGGWGDDLINLDDDLSTGGGANRAPDTHPSYEDLGFGGAGRDILIGNTGGDRLIDWAGEFNSYIVPFAPFGLATVSRQPSPQLVAFLMELAVSHGANLTRAADLGTDAARFGEPYGDLGLVTQRDAEWRDQTGAPADPQPGNVAGGTRDVLRTAGNGTAGGEGTLASFGTTGGAEATSEEEPTMAATASTDDGAPTSAPFTALDEGSGEEQLSAEEPITITTTLPPSEEPIVATTATRPTVEEIVSLIRSSDIVIVTGPGSAGKPAGTFVYDEATDSFVPVALPPNQGRTARDAPLLTLLDSDGALFAYVDAQGRLWTIDDVDPPGRLSAQDEDEWIFSGLIDTKGPGNGHGQQKR